MLLRWVSMCVWALVAASAVFWGLRLFTRPTPVPPQTQVADLSGAARGDLSRVLGTDPAPVAAAAVPEPTADARFNLLGVVSPRGPAGSAVGVALISVDGKPPKAYKLGAVVDGQNVLQAVSMRGASLGPAGGPVLVALNIPPPQPPATGQLPSLVQPPAAGPTSFRQALQQRQQGASPVVAPAVAPGGIPAPQNAQPLPPPLAPPPPAMVPPQVDNRGNPLQ